MGETIFYIFRVNIVSYICRPGYPSNLSSAILLQRDCTIISFEISCCSVKAVDRSSQDHACTEAEGG